MRDHLLARSTVDRVAVIGLGYIGLPTAAALATQGTKVIGVDVNQGVVDAVNRGEVPFVEPDLDIAVSGAVARGLLSAATEMPEADAYLVAVPTPFTGDYQPDLSYIEAATRAIAPRLRGGEIVILESTSPPGATERMGEWLLEERPDLALAGTGPGKPEISLAHCPERVLPGRVMIEIVTNDRIIGGLTPECSQRAAEVYRIFCQGELIHTDSRTAEMAKLVENSYRDVNIAFANELSSVAEKVGVNVWELIELANHHPRVNILQPGPGVGGHCIAVDPWFIVAAAPEQARLIRTAREVNDAQPHRVIAQVMDAVEGKEKPVVACLGLAFKANIDDLRESPALHITEVLSSRLRDRGLVLAVEPHIEELPKPLADSGVELSGLEQALTAADVVVLLVDHDAFAEVDHRALEGTQIVDTRGQWGIGRGSRRHRDSPHARPNGPSRGVC